MGIPSIVVAAALAWCADNPTDRACAPRSVETVRVSTEQGDRLEALADRIRFRHSATRSRGSERDAQGNNRDIWRPSRSGDCEDRVLWAWQELDEIGLIGSAEILLTLPNRDTRRGHVVLAIHTDSGTLILDPLRDGVRAVDEYQDSRLYVARDGVGGRWTPL